jgi:membrane-associated phospholipid phosphatase
MNTIADIISLSIIIVFLLPWILFVATNKLVFLVFGIATLCVDGSTKIWKRIFGTHSIFGRPKGACNCDIFNSNGDQSGRRGFPSGHMTVVTFVTTVMALMYPNVATNMIGISLVIAMGWARHHKKCHNLAQIITGAIYGCMLAIIFYTMVGT